MVIFHSYVKLPEGIRHGERNGDSTVSPIEHHHFQIWDLTHESMESMELDGRIVCVMSYGYHNKDVSYYQTLYLALYALFHLWPFGGVHHD
jgi:hypothetical protein